MRRAIVLVLCAPLLVLGCSSGSGGGGGSKSGSVSVDVRYRPDPPAVGPVTWTVTVTNGTDRALALTFPNGQRADVTLRSGKQPLYQWSRGIMFTQSVGNVTVPAGAERSFVLDEPGLDVDPGTYQLTATVVATGRDDLTVTRSVTVRGR